MIRLRARPLALGCVLFLAGAAVSAADQPDSPPAPVEDKTEAPASEGSEAPAAEPAENAADERICRHVKLDMSSRRKTKVCRTLEEWRELNNPR